MTEMHLDVDDLMAAMAHDIARLSKEKAFLVAQNKTLTKAMEQQEGANAKAPGVPVVD